MITVDISNIWGEVNLPDLLAIESEVAAAHEALMEDDRWKHLICREGNPELFRILLAAERIRNDSDVCVVVGMDGSCLGSRAAVELLQGPNRNLGRGKGNPQMFYAGNSLSTRQWNELSGLLKDKDFSVIAISRTGTDLESAIALRSLRWMLERKYGTDGAKQRIYAVTDPKEKVLQQMVQEEGWDSFSISSGGEESCSVLTAAGLLPMAVAGLDIREVLQGAAEAKEEYAVGSFENPAWQYAAVRNLLYRGGKTLEVLAYFDPGFRAFGRWWQRLFAESGGREGRDLFPATAELTEDLSGLGQLIQEGSRSIFETLLRFDPPTNRLEIGGDWKNLDDLNYLEGKYLDSVEEAAYETVLACHADAGVPVITVDAGELTEGKVGELFFFWDFSCSISARLLGIDPADNGGRESCRQKLLRILGKPEKDQ